jgi:hypothetical protein
MIAGPRQNKGAFALAFQKKDHRKRKESAEALRLQRRPKQILLGDPRLRRARRL